MSSTTTMPETEILSRVIDPGNPSFTPEVARSVLQLRFAEPDVERMNELAAKSRTGDLNEAESAQLEAYLFVGGMLDLMHSKARLSLQNTDNGHG